MSNPTAGPRSTARGGAPSAIEGPSIAVKSPQAPFYAFIACNVLLAISALLPWETLGALTFSGLDIAKGWIVLLASLAAGGTAAGSLLRERPVSGVRAWQFVSAGAAVGLSGLHIVQLTSYCSGDELFCLQPGIGVGAMLSLLFGLVLGGAAMFASPKKALMGVSR
jgi:hypothetical protein